MSRFFVVPFLMAMGLDPGLAPAAAQSRETEVVLALPLAPDSAFSVVRAALGELGLGPVDPIREPDQRTARVGYQRRRSAQGGAYVILLARVVRSGDGGSRVHLSGLVRDVTASARERPLPLSSRDEDWAHVLSLAEKLRALGASIVPPSPRLPA